MDDISLKNTKVLSNQLDLKGNSAKNLVELRNSLQLGTILNGKIVDITKTGEIIFATNVGKFISQNHFDLKQGDSIVIQINTNDPKTVGEIVKINNTKPPLTQPVELKLVRLTPEDKNKEQAAKAQTSAVNSSLDATSLSAKTKLAEGNITYLNLSKLEPSTHLHQLLKQSIPSDIDNKPIPLSFSINTSNNLRSSILGEVTASPSLQINGEVEKFIKTEFGIITTNDPRIQVGQTLNIQLVKINHQLVNLDINRKLEDFITTLNNNWQIISKLHFKETYAQSIDFLEPLKVNIKKLKDINRTLEKKDPKLSIYKLQELNDVLDNNTQLKSIKNLAQEYKKLSELLLDKSLLKPNDNNDFAVVIPFYNGYEIVEHMVQISEPKKNFLQFKIVATLDYLGQIQLDGLIEFQGETKNIVKFDLIFRSSEHSTDASLKQLINKIFSANQEAKGIRGNLTFGNISENK